MPLREGIEELLTHPTSGDLAPVASKRIFSILGECGRRFVRWSGWMVISICSYFEIVYAASSGGGTRYARVVVLVENLDPLWVAILHLFDVCQYFPVQGRIIFAQPVNEGVQFLDEGEADFAEGGGGLIA